MKKKNIAILLCMAAMLLTCKKEDQMDFSFFEGYYDGNSRLSSVGITKYCKGNKLKLNVSNKNEVFMYAECDREGVLSKFEGYHIGPSRVDKATFRDLDNIYEAEVVYSIVDDKTDKEVGYFRKDFGNWGTWWIFSSQLLVSTNRDSLFHYTGRFLVK